MIDDAIQKLVLYGIENGLIQLSDRIYTTNRILEVLQKDDFAPTPVQGKNSGGILLEPVLKEILDYAVEKLDALSEKFGVSFVISASVDKENMPESVQKYVSHAL